MRISLKKLLTHSLLAISIAAPTYFVASTIAEAGGNYHKRHYSGGSVQGSFGVRSSGSVRYTSRTQYNSYRRTYVNRYQRAPVRYYSPPVYPQPHHHHYVQSHHHHYNQPHTPYCGH